MTSPHTAPPPRFLADRRLGRVTVGRLCERGWDILQLSDIFAGDAPSISDEKWLAYAGHHGLAGLTTDKRIRHQRSFEMAHTPVFALSDGSLSIAEIVHRFDEARARIWARASNPAREFWVVYAGGRIERRSPSAGSAHGTGQQ